MLQKSTLIPSVRVWMAAMAATTWLTESKLAAVRPAGRRNDVVFGPITGAASRMYSEGAVSLHFSRSWSGRWPC